jgi:hypothetical protein
MIRRRIFSPLCKKGAIARSAMGDLRSKAALQPRTRYNQRTFFRYRYNTRQTTTTIPTSTK